MRPSYRLASYSGIPMPASAPMRPPSAPIAPAPASAATIGPAAINGPSPGIASAPMPVSQPRTPPAMPPAATPVVAPSGALVFFSCAKSLVPSFSGKSTEMSVLRKPALRRCSTASSTAARLEINAKRRRILSCHKCSFSPSPQPGPVWIGAAAYGYARRGPIAARPMLRGTFLHRGFPNACGEG